MSKITPELLAKLAPGTKKELRDRFIPDLNLTLPVYGIDTKFEVAGFLATACFESDYFKTMREYGKGKGRKYGVATGPYKLIYYGRGIFQNTWMRGYQAFTHYVKTHWSFIQPRAGIADPPDFVKDPELLATTFWAVEAACWYWEENHLAKYAKQGLDGFFALQGLVNRGSASKKALDYDDRLMVYKRTLNSMPDNFTLSADSASSTNEQAGRSESSTSTTSTSAADKPLLKLMSEGDAVKDLQKLLGLNPDGGFDFYEEDAVKTFQQAHGLKVDGIVGEQTWAALEAQKPAENAAALNPGDGVPVSAPNKTDVVVEKEPDVVTEKPKGFFGALWQKVTGAFGGGVTADIAIEKAQQAQTLGLSARTWQVIFWFIIGGLAIWILYHFVAMKVIPWGKWIVGRIRTNQLVAGNFGADSVQVIESSKLAEYEAKGYTVVRRS